MSHKHKWSLHYVANDWNNSLVSFRIEAICVAVINCLNILDEKEITRRLNEWETDHGTDTERNQE